MEDKELETWFEKLTGENKKQVDPPEKSVAPRQRKKNQDGEPWHKQVLLYLHDIVYLLSAVILVLLLCFRVVVVSGTSMNTTLLDGDYLLLLGNVFYQNPEYGDVIVASKDSFENGSPIVKRVIATGGQWVDIDFEAGIVYVGDSMNDMKPLDEPYTYTPTNVQEGVAFPVQVPEGCLFVMGDNRNGSKDSRNPDIGMVDKREVLGKVIFLFLPGTNGTDIYGNPKQPRDFSRIGVVN